MEGAEGGVRAHVESETWLCGEHGGGEADRERMWAQSKGRRT